MKTPKPFPRKLRRFESDRPTPPPRCTSPNYCPLAEYVRGGGGRRVCPNRDCNSKLVKTLMGGCPWRKIVKKQ